jgi:PAS domain S-box-containing protein
MNEASEILTGWSGDAALGKPLEDVLRIRRGPDEGPVVEMLTTISSGKPLLGPAGHGFLTAQDGSQRIVEADGAPIRDHIGESRGAVIAVRDITAKRRIEQEMIKAEKMETVGVLAAGIAHDFNNILAAVLANLSLARSLAEDSSDLSELLTDAKTATLRAREITRQLRMFSTDERPVRRLTSLAEILNETAGFSLRGSAATSNISTAQDLWLVEVDAGQVSQVFNNLLINAMQAMPAGGEIAITGENLFVDESSSWPLPVGRYVRIRIQDHGSGIRKEHMARLFEPFFTTKPKGSGLGLASVYTIVRSHGGHVTVESELGCGSTFSVYLPAVADGSFSESEKKYRTLEDGHRVLLADDDVEVRKSTCRLLEHLGWHVEVVEDASTAVAEYQKALRDGKRFDVVILDLSGPGALSGAAAARELHMIDHDVRAVAASGHFDEKTFPRESQGDFRAVLMKPFTEEELCEAIEQALK